MNANQDRSAEEASGDNQTVIENQAIPENKTRFEKTNHAFKRNPQEASSASQWWHWDSFIDAVKNRGYWRCRSHRMRNFLTMLGIIIGIASVVSVVALGNGTQKQILSNIASMGTNTIDIRPGTGFGDRRSGQYVP